MPQNYTEFRTPRTCFLLCNKDSVCEHPRKSMQQTQKPPFDDTKHLGVYFKGLEMIFRHFWDFSGLCLHRVHLENQILDWGDLNEELLAKVRESFPSILLHNAEAVTPPTREGIAHPFPSRLIDTQEPQLSALQSNKQGRS